VTAENRLVDLYFYTNAMVEMSQLITKKKGALIAAEFFMFSDKINYKRDCFYGEKFHMIVMEKSDLTEYSPCKEFTMCGKIGDLARDISEESFSFPADHFPRS